MEKTLVVHYAHVECPFAVRPHRLDVSYLPHIESTDFFFFLKRARCLIWQCRLTFSCQGFPGNDNFKCAVGVSREAIGWPQAFLSSLGPGASATIPGPQAQ